MVWAAGQRLQGGKYIIEKILGEGGFGITYQARHTLLEQLMVIKTPNEKRKNDPEYQKYLKRFIEEGRRLEKLSEKQHPNIVRVRDLFEEGGIYCLVMDFVAGESLFDLVRRRGALPPTEAVEYVRQIGEALTVVHQAKLVHRDAHPGNIMVQRDGKAVLIDFGIAGEILQTVKSSKHFGNLTFAPYEQMTGSREPTVDVYCLAASLYYAVTGQCPTSSLDRKLNNVRLIKPKQHAEISDELNRAILKGMELEANNRPKSMQEWLKLLEVANRTVKVSLPPKKQRNIRWGRLTRRVLLIPQSMQECLKLLEVANRTVKVSLPPKKRRSIPWDRLTVVLLIYAVLGFLSAPSAWASAWAWAWASAWASALVLTWAWASALALASALAWAWAWAWSPALALILTWALASALAWALAWASEELLKSFSKFHTFLIVLGTSWLGLGLGWLAYQHHIFPRFR